jgi:chromosome segregation ATPase
MPKSLFDQAPIVKTLYDTFSKLAPNDFLKLVPQGKEFDNVRSKMTSLSNNMSKYQQKLNSASPVVNTIAVEKKLYRELQQKEHDLENWKQELHDIQTMKTFLDFQLNKRDGDGSQFASWYIDNIKNQYDSASSDIQKKEYSFRIALDREIAIKYQLMQYQSLIIETLRVWLEFIDEKINENSTLMSQIDAIYSTSQRNLSLDYRDILLMNKRRDTLWYYCLVLFLVSLFIAIILYREVIYSYFFSQAS